VRGVVLIGSEAGINTAEEKEGYRQVFDQWKSHGPLGEVGQLVGNLLFGDPALTEKWLPVWEARDRSSLMHPVETLLSRDDITSRLSDITCPVLVIHGTDDVAITIDKAEIVTAAVPDCRGLVRVRGAGHSPNMTHPVEVNSALVQFLDELTV
jgi:pimeloyl-ACP methyl ester carboxylesterase